MTLAETLQQKLADLQPTEEGRHSVNIPLPDHGWAVQLTAHRVDSVGCLLAGVDIQRVDPVAEGIELLEAQARRAAGRVTGLLEPLRLVEVDRGTGIALLRSDSPAQKNGAVTYYEVKFVGRNRVTIERVQATRSSPAKREPISYALTHEVLAKLIDDLVRE